MLGIIFGFCIMYSSQGFGEASLLLSSLASEAWKVSDMADALGISMHSFGQNLDRLYSECPSTTHEFLAASIAERKHEIEESRVALARLVGMLQGLPDLLAGLLDKSQVLTGSLTWCQILPLAGLIVCQVCAGMLVFIAEYSGPKFAKRCNCFQLPCLASSLFVPVLVLVATCAAAELLLAVFSSAMCSRPESALLNYVREELGDSPAFNLTEQYVHNETSNGAVDNLHLLHSQLLSWDEWVATYGGAIERSCPDWNAANVSQNLRSMIAELRTAGDIMQPARMTQEWTHLRELVCSTGVSDLGKLVLTNLLLGLLCLPLLACGLSCLLEHLVAERASGGPWYAFNLLSTEDADQSS